MDGGKERVLVASEAIMFDIRVGLQEVCAERACRRFLRRYASH
jgi:hypothetical protein